jgi:secondary thiamine-phosphate synthase enzyme
MTILRFSVRTTARTDLVEITAEVGRLVAASGVEEGVCRIFVPHTTAGVTINENADPSVQRDIKLIFDRMVPWEGGYAHAEGNSAAHVKASLTGSSVAVPIEKGSLVLGTWQGIYFCDFDGPRSRKVIVKVMED